MTSILGVSGLELQSSGTKPDICFGEHSSLGGAQLSVGGDTSSDLGGQAPKCLTVAPVLDLILHRVE